MKKKKKYLFIFTVSLFFIFACGENKENYPIGKDSLLINGFDRENILKLDSLYQEKIDEKYSEILEKELQKYEDYVETEDTKKIELQKEIIYKRIDYLELTEDFKEHLSNVREKNTSKKTRDLKINLNTEIKIMQKIYETFDSYDETMQDEKLRNIKDKLENFKDSLTKYK